MPSPDLSPRAAPSLQRRLALELSVPLGLMLVLLFVLLDHLVSRELYARMDAGLLDRGRAIAAFLGAQPGDLAALRRLMPEYELPGHTDFFEVWDESGVSRFRSATSAGRALMRPEPAPGQAPVYYDVSLPDGHRGRALAMSLGISLDGRPARIVLAVATERAPVEKLEARIGYALLGVVAAALVLTLLIALLAVRRGLAPIQRFGKQLAEFDGTVVGPSAGAIVDGSLPRELRPFVRALNLAFERLYAVIERERRFSQDVAHELRTPLAEIRTSVEIAVQQPGDAAATQAAFAACLGAVERMQRAVDTLLLMARHEAGHTVPPIDPLDFSALLGSLLDALRPFAAKRAVVFDCQCPVGVWVRSDVGSLERIVSNLLRNAMDYAPYGSHVSVSVHEEPDGVILEVRNPAPGFASTDLENLGQRFWRKYPGGGTAANAGLGLALALTLARSLGLALDFSLEQGSFVVRCGRLARL